MLAGSFFRIENLIVEEGRVSASLHLEPSHVIFNGHFPGLPVVPGVCMIQIVKEVLEQVLDRQTNLKSARNIKFLNVLNPNVHPEVLIELTFRENAEHFNLTARIYFESIIFFKMDAVFIF